MVTVQIPSSLRAEVAGLRSLQAPANTVREALHYLRQNYPTLYRSVCDETGAIRRHVNLFVNNVCLAKTDSLAAPLTQGDTLSIMPAVSGG